jgi:hypothetical protein
MSDVTKSGRLPDFIFERRPDIELEGYEVAGMLLTDIPKTKGITEGDRRLICEIIEQLTEGMRNNPDMDSAHIWRKRTKPADALEPPFDQHLLQGRIQSCIAVLVTSGTRVQVPSDLKRLVSGGAGH